MFHLNEKYLNIIQEQIIILPEIGERTTNKALSSSETTIVCEAFQRIKIARN